jgi:hypothetical protein
MDADGGDCEIACCSACLVKVASRDESRVKFEGGMGGRLALLEVVQRSRGSSDHVIQNSSLSVQSGEYLVSLVVSIAPYRNRSKQPIDSPKSPLGRTAGVVGSNPTGGPESPESSGSWKCEWPRKGPFVLNSPQTLQINSPFSLFAASFRCFWRVFMRLMILRKWRLVSLRRWDLAPQLSGLVASLGEAVETRPLA